MIELPLHFVACEAPRPHDLESQIADELGTRDKAYAVCIYDFAVPDAEATERDGRARFRNVPYIAVRPKGERDYTARPMADEDKRRFPRAWEAYRWFQNRPTATSVALLPGITPADLRELDELKLETIEKLAAHADDIGTLDPFRVLARRFLTLSKPRVRPVGDGTFIPVTEAA